MKNIIVKILRVLVVIGIAPLLMAPTVLKPKDVYERIEIEKYLVQEECDSYINDYRIILTSKYKQFKNYRDFRNHNYEDPIVIENDLYEIRPRFVFRNKATIELILIEEEFNDLIELDSYIVYYPKTVFDNKWLDELWDDENPEFPYKFNKPTYLYSNLSTEGLGQYKEQCAKKSERQRPKENHTVNDQILLNQMKELSGNGNRTISVKDTVKFALAGGALCKKYAEEVGGDVEAFSELNVLVVLTATELGYMEDFPALVRELRPIGSMLDVMLKKEHGSALKAYNDWCMRFYNSYQNGIKKAYE